MDRRIRLVAIAIAGIVSACGPGPGSTSPSASSLPLAGSYTEFATSTCLAFDALWEAVGNPDTADWSAVTRSLDAAVAARNTTEADRLAATITARLEEGRRHATAAAGWAPGAPLMTHMDRLLVAFEAWTEAKRVKAADPAAQDPQAAFEAAGGVDAWRAMLGAVGAIPRPPGGAFGRCPNVPVSL